MLQAHGLDRFWLCPLQSASRVMLCRGAHLQGPRESDELDVSCGEGVQVSSGPGKAGHCRQHRLSRLVAAHQTYKQKQQVNSILLAVTARLMPGTSVALGELDTHDKQPHTSPLRHLLAQVLLETANIPKSCHEML